jgi:hypothetical protein
MLRNITARRTACQLISVDSQVTGWVGNIAQAQKRVRRVDDEAGQAALLATAIHAAILELRNVSCAPSP